MNYSIRNLVIAGGLAIAAIAAVLIYTSNVQQAAKQGQARVSVLVAQVDIPAVLWDDLRAEGLLRLDAPTPTGTSA